MIPAALAALGWQRYVIYAVVALAIAAVVWMHGYTRGEIKLYEYQAEQAVAKVAIIKKIETVKEIVRVEHVRRALEIKTVFVEIEKEAVNVPVRAHCNVTAGWMRSHDAAADGRAVGAEGRLDDGSDTHITEAEALRVVRTNYRSFHEVANHLKACRAYVTGLAEATR